MVTDPVSWLHAQHSIFLSVQVGECVVATAVVYTLSFYVFFQFCFPVLASGFLWHEMPLSQDMCPIPLGIHILLALTFLLLLGSGLERGRRLIQGPQSSKWYAHREGKTVPPGEQSLSPALLHSHRL